MGGVLRKGGKIPPFPPTHTLSSFRVKKSPSPPAPYLWEISPGGCVRRCEAGGGRDVPLITGEYDKNGGVWGGNGQKYMCMARKIKSAGTPHPGEDQGGLVQKGVVGHQVKGAQNHAQVHATRIQGGHPRKKK